MVVAYIGLGSNLDQPAQQLADAQVELNQLADTTLRAFSSLYLSKPMDGSDQPDYFNAVAIIETNLDALELLGKLQEIEQIHQRVRMYHWGPRTLDLDLLLYGEELINTPELVVPHPGISQRDFVLLPMLELNPALGIPAVGSLDTLLAVLPDSGIKKL